MYLVDVASTNLAVQELHGRPEGGGGGGRAEPADQQAEAVVGRVDDVAHLNRRRLVVHAADAPVNKSPPLSQRLVPRRQRLEFLVPSLSIMGRLWFYVSSCENSLIGEQFQSAEADLGEGGVKEGKREDVARVRKGAHLGAYQRKYAARNI